MESAVVESEGSGGFAGTGSPALTVYSAKGASDINGASMIGGSTAPSASVGWSVVVSVGS